jgi:hypothetical protein
MERVLNSGPGICQGTHRLVVKPVLAAISLGATPDVMNGALKAIHRINRNGDPADFVAAAFPLMGNHAGSMFTGHELEAIGSESVLQALLDSDIMKMMARRGMLEAIHVSPVIVERGQMGASYTRVRSPVKHTAGWVRRTTARAERRGKALGKPVAVRQYDSSGLLSLTYGDAVLHVAESLSVYMGGEIQVNTYGFSTWAQPSVLPVRPHASKLEKLGDAA